MIGPRRLKNALCSLLRPAHSVLYMEDDQANWVLKWEKLSLRDVANSLGVTTRLGLPAGMLRQCVFYSSKYFLMEPEPYFRFGRRIGTSYFHGYPGRGSNSADVCFANLKQYHERVSRIQVSHQYMRTVLLETGIAPDKLHLIPIGVNPDLFSVQTPESKRAARDKYSIPQNAVVVGSLQKDGKGWGDGMEPKSIKGPDVFLDTVAILRQSVPELHVLLSGPSRGYVKQGLENLNIPYTHVFLRDYPEINNLYNCLDLYIVASREEGGPKAILESMACGVPLATTRVGQAVDLVRHGENAFLADVEDAEALAHYSLTALSDSEVRQRFLEHGLQTVRENTYEAQTPLWKKFFTGFVRLK